MNFSKGQKLADSNFQEVIRPVDIFSQSPISIEIYDSMGQLVDVNQACLDLFGLKNLESIKGFNLFNNPHLTAHARNEIKSGKSVKYQLEYDFELIKSLKLYETTKNDTCFLECYINPSFNNRKEIKGYIVHITDISERMKSQKAELESKELLTSFIKHSSIYAYVKEVTPVQSKVLIASENFAEMIGIPGSQMIGKNMFELFPEEFAVKITADDWLVSSTGKDLKLEEELNDRTYTTFKFPICIGDKKFLAGYSIDISDQKNIEKKLENQSRELVEFNATKDKFLSILAHDLKNPFNAILGFTDLLLSNYKNMDEETLLKGLKTIESASNHAYKLLENLLIWTQNQSGRIQFSPGTLNLHKQISESLGMVESEANKKGIKVVVSLKKSINIFADKNMLDSMLRNLITNAIKFSHRGQKVRITAAQTDHEIQVSVADHGVGIAAEKIPSIFKIDTRTNTLGTENEQGTGLGLILCKEFINRHKGHIWIESTPGKGSIFSFGLPLK